MNLIKNKIIALSKNPLQLLIDGFYTLMGGIIILTFGGRLKAHLATTKLVAPRTGLYYDLYHYISIYLQQFLLWMERAIKGNNGSVIAIILITILIRLLLMPLTLINSRNIVLSRERKKLLYPQLQLIDDTLISVPVSNKQRSLLKELKRKCYLANGIRNTEWMIWVVVAIQIIVLTCLYQVVAYSPELMRATVLGISLAKRSMLLATIAAMMYFLEQLVMILGMTPKERAVLPTSTYWLTPVSIFCSGFFLPSVLTVYWIASACFLLIQNYLNYWVLRPYLTKQTQDGYKIKEIITDDKIDEILDKGNFEH